MKSINDIRQRNESLWEKIQKRETARREITGLVENKNWTDAFQKAREAGIPFFYRSQVEEDALKVIDVANEASRVMRGSWRLFAASEHLKTAQSALEVLNLALVKTNNESAEKYIVAIEEKDLDDSQRDVLYLLKAELSNLEKDYEVLISLPEKEIKTVRDFAARIKNLESVSEKLHTDFNKIAVRFPDSRLFIWLKRPQSSSKTSFIIFSEGYVTAFIELTGYFAYGEKQNVNISLKKIKELLDQVEGDPSIVLAYESLMAWEKRKLMWETLDEISERLKRYTGAFNKTLWADNEFDLLVENLANLNDIFPEVFAVGCKKNDYVDAKITNLLRDIKESLKQVRIDFRSFVDVDNRNSWIKYIDDLIAYIEDQSQIGLEFYENLLHHRNLISINSTRTER
jgi:hypothetical protein